MKRFFIAMLLLLISLPVTADLIVHEAIKSLRPRESGVYPNLEATLRFLIVQEHRHHAKNTLCGIVYGFADGSEVGIWFWKEMNLLIYDPRTPDNKAYNADSERMFYDARIYNLNHAVISDRDFNQCRDSGQSEMSCLGVRFLAHEVKETQADCDTNGTEYVFQPFAPSAEVSGGR